jgi:hypothetical protein
VSDTYAAYARVTNRFGVGSNLMHWSSSLGNRRRPKHFYYLRHDGTEFSTFGTIATNGTVADLFGVGNNFDALTFAPETSAAGPKHFYYLRRDSIRLRMTVADGTSPHALAPERYYMMFVVNSNGVPSARRVRL